MAKGGLAQIAERENKRANNFQLETKKAEAFGDSCSVMEGAGNRLILEENPESLGRSK